MKQSADERAATLNVVEPSTERPCNLQCSTLKKCSVTHSHMPSPGSDVTVSFRLRVFVSSFTVGQMASSLDGLAGDAIEIKKAILVSRRCIILALVGSTPIDTSSLTIILKDGYLSTVKHWMDDILSGSLGK
jgi:hypothetical protein